jgi:hypothetical protein
MALREHATTAATVVAQLDGIVSAFPEEARPGARELVLAVSSLLARLDRSLRADVDTEFLSCRTHVGICVAAADDGSAQPA